MLFIPIQRGEGIGTRAGRACVAPMGVSRTALPRGLGGAGRRRGSPCRGAAGGGEGEPVGGGMVGRGCSPLPAVIRRGRRGGRRGRRRRWSWSRWKEGGRRLGGPVGAGGTAASPRRCPGWLGGGGGPECQLPPPPAPGVGGEHRSCWLRPRLGDASVPSPHPRLPCRGRRMLRLASLPAPLSRRFLLPFGRNGAEPPSPNPYPLPVEPPPPPASPGSLGPACLVPGGHWLPAPRCRQCRCHACRPRHAELLCQPGKTP